MLAQPGDLVILAASDKPDDKGVPDFMRFKGGGQYFGHGVLGGEEEPSTGIPIETLKSHFEVDDEPLSARNLRRAVETNDVDVIRRYLPEDVITNDQALASIFDILDVSLNSTAPLEELLLRLVEEQLSPEVFAKAANMKKQGKLKKEEDELEEVSVAAGGVAGSPGAFKRRRRNVNKEQLIQKVTDYLLTRSKS